MSPVSTMLKHSRWCECLPSKAAPVVG